MDLKKTIITIVCILVVAVTGILLFVYWPAITGTINNSQYLTPEQGQEMYDRGYNDGYKDKTENTAQLDYYRSLIDGYYTSIQDYERQLAVLQEANLYNENAIDTLQVQKESLEEQVTNLATANASNTATINELGLVIDSLQSQVAILQNSNDNKTNQISSLNNQILSLQNVIAQLQNTNTMNVNTITALNTQIAGLNAQISTLSLQIQNNSASSSVLQERIDELETTVSYYETYIDNLSQNGQVVVTFEFDGSVYNIQIIPANTTTTVNNPTSTNYEIFNGWTVNNTAINLATYTFSQNTRVIADVTHKHQVKFSVDGTDVSTQYVVSGNYATLPTAPTKQDYVFDGWTINGVDVVNVSTTAITANTTFTAKFSRLYSVSFVYESNTVDTQSVVSGNYATAPTVSNTTYKVFNGWTVNGTAVNVSTYHITANITFVASITYYYDVNFVVDNTTYDTQLVQSGNYATLPSTPTKQGYDFVGWSLDGTNVVDLSNTSIVSNTTFIALFEESIIPFGDLSWAEISSISSVISQRNMTNEEIYEEYGWSVGNTKKVLINGYNYTFVILGFNHDSTVNGNKVGISIGLKEAYRQSAVKMYTSEYNSNGYRYYSFGGYDDTRLRNTTLTGIFDNLPSDLKSLIIPVHKTYLMRDASGYHLEAVDDSIWLFSSYEVGGTNYYSSSVGNANLTQAQYDYFKVENNRKIYRYSTNDTGFWLRDNSTSSDGFQMIGTSGGISIGLSGSSGTGTSSGAKGEIVFGFCI